MNRYVTAFLFVILALLAGFIFFIQPHLRNFPKEKIHENFLLSIDPDKVHSMDIRNGEDAIQINRQGTDWKVSSKVADRASPEVVAKILQAAKDLRVFDKISDEEFKNQLKIKDFGLKSPRQCFKILGNGGDKQEIWFGNDAAIKGRVYACKKNSETVYVVPNHLQTVIARPFNDFRDRQLTQLTPDQIRSFAIKRGDGHELEVQQEGNHWKIFRPLDAQADTQKIHKFLEALLTLPILEFVANDSEDLARFGIDERSPSLTFKAENAPAATLKIGTPNEKGYYTQFTERKSIFLLPASVKKLLETSEEELRERSLLYINPDILDRIVIRSGSQSLVLSREGREWKGEQEGGETEFPVSDKKIQHLLSILRQQNVKNFLSVPENALAAYGLDPPQASIDFYSLLSENTPEAPAGSHKIASIIFSFPSKENIVYARTADSPEIFQVDPAIIMLLSLEPSRWK